MNIPNKSLVSCEDPSMPTEVVRWVRILCTQTYANEKYSEDSHILTAKGMFRDMQLNQVGSVKNCMTQHNVGNLQFINKGLVVSLILLINDSTKPF